MSYKVGDKFKLKDAYKNNEWFYGKEIKILAIDYSKYWVESSSNRNFFMYDHELEREFDKIDSMEESNGCKHKWKEEYYFNIKYKTCEICEAHWEKLYAGKTSA